MMPEVNPSQISFCLFVPWSDYSVECSMQHKKISNKESATWIRERYTGGVVVLP